MNIEVPNKFSSVYSLDDLAFVASKEFSDIQGSSRKRNREEEKENSLEPFNKKVRLTESIETTQKIQYLAEISPGLLPLEKKTVGIAEDLEKEVTVDINLSGSTPEGSVSTPPLGCEELLSDDNKGSDLLLNDQNSAPLVDLFSVKQRNYSFCFSLFEKKKYSHDYFLQNFESIDVISKNFILKIEDLNANNNIENRVKILFYTSGIAENTLVAERVLFKNKEKNQNTLFFLISKTSNVDKNLIKPEIEIKQKIVKSRILNGEFLYGTIKTWRVMAVFLDGCMIYERCVKQVDLRQGIKEKQPSQFFLSLSAQGVKHEVKSSERLELSKYSEIIPEVTIVE